jgi:predicted metal-binding membrane protein
LNRTDYHFLFREGSHVGVRKNQANPSAAATALSIALLVAADGAGWIQHGASRPGEAILAWGAAFVLGWTLMMASMSLPSMSPFLRAVERVGGGAAAATAAAGVAALWIISGVLFSLLLWLAGGAVEALPPGGAERL